MKNIIQLFLITSLITGQLVIAQVPASNARQWKVVQATALENGESFSCSGFFEFSGDQIHFIQKNGLVRYDFKITGMTVRQEGQSLDYEILFRGVSGIIRLDNGINGSTLIIDIPKSGFRILPFKFFIQLLS